ncbi:MAG: transferase [Xanthobacteraceae bacterium]|nr:transferase [Xanthobacteraceae bacterium]MBX3523751.1 transferase [Xanthobacteraceae bacterium]MCW5674238.1 transferase [Xanthobacteraceae bacterium]
MAIFSDLQFVDGAPALAPQEASPLIGRMRLMLSTLAPRSDAEALRLLRTSFPESTLGERLSALSRTYR